MTNPKQGTDFAANPRQEEVTELAESRELKQLKEQEDAFMGDMGRCEGMLRLYASNYTTNMGQLAQGLKHKKDSVMPDKEFFILSDIKEVFETDEIPTAEGHLTKLEKKYPQPRSQRIADELNSLRARLDEQKEWLKLIKQVLGGHIPQQQLYEQKKLADIEATKRELCASIARSYDRVKTQLEQLNSIDQTLLDDHQKSIIQTAHEAINPRPEIAQMSLADLRKESEKIDDIKIGRVIMQVQNTLRSQVEQKYSTVLAKIEIEVDPEIKRLQTGIKTYKSNWRYKLHNFLAKISFLGIKSGEQRVKESEIKIQSWIIKKPTDITGKMDFQTLERESKKSKETIDAELPQHIRTTNKKYIREIEEAIGIRPRI